MDFGVPSDHHPKAVAVPYEAADIPSKRSEYAHPDVAGILSYICYYQKGLTEKQFRICLNKLLILPEVARKFSYEQWLTEINGQKYHSFKQKDISKINIESKTEFSELYEIFKFCRPTIAFWLNQEIFPKNLRQHVESISSSSWDIANAEQSTGFSGTKDNRWLFPSQLKWSPSSNLQIRGTDGKMIDLLLHHTLDTYKINAPQSKG